MYRIINQALKARVNLALLENSFQLIHPGQRVELDLPLEIPLNFQAKLDKLGL